MNEDRVASVAYLICLIAITAALWGVGQIQPWLDTIWTAVLWNGRLVCEIRYAHLVMLGCIPILIALLVWIRHKQKHTPTEPQR
jgi:hypothetical protein